MTPETIARLRDETPGCRSVIHLNNAGAGLMPRAVLDTVQAHLSLEAEVGGYEAEDRVGSELAGCYEALGRLVGTSARNIAVVENATVAYAQALSSLPFAAGDAIVTTTNDYISNQIMFLSLAKRLGVRILRAEDDEHGCVDPESVAELVRRERPRLVAVTHMPTNSGLIQPVEEVGRVCRDTDAWYLVDACQTVGQLPLDLDRVGCDFLSATARKFLRGPRGVGFLAVSNAVLEQQLTPLFPDMRGARWTEPDRFVVEPTARRFENWEFAHGLTRGMGQAAELALELGLEPIAARVRALAAKLRDSLDNAGLRVLDQGRDKGGIVTVQIPFADGGEALHQALLGRRINSSLTRREFAQLDFARKQVDWALRLSPHYYNTDAELQEAVEAIEELTRHG